ncbi:MAG: PAS domain S-box protein [Candidatus Riflebacteria bacterium]|nr:PAS domain S-box protein [Candidatus Riflebacteria bacterium]
MTAKTVTDVVEDLLKLRVAPTRGRKALPYVTLAILIVISLISWQHFEEQARTRQKQQFDEHVTTMLRKIQERMSRYEMIMRGGAGLFIASAQVTREEWQEYVSYRQIQEFFPGILSMGIARLVRNADLAKHQQEIRVTGIPGYAVHPPGERAEYCPLIYLEPLDDGSRPAFGYDLLSEPVRRAALDRARVQATCAMSEKITLKHSFGKYNGAGFLLCLPVYNSGKTSETDEQRSSALWGYVVSAFYVEDFIRGIIGENSHKIEFKIFDGSELDPDKLMYTSHVYSEDCNDSMFVVSKVLELYGRNWTLFFHTTPDFEAQVADKMPGTLFAGLLVISLLIFLFLKMLEGTGERALAFARDLTGELENEKAWLNAVINTAIDAIIAMDTDGKVLIWNSSAVQLFGYSAEEALGKEFIRLIIPLRFYDEAVSGLKSLQQEDVSQKHGMTREFIAMRKDGQEFPVEVSISAQRPLDNIGIVTVIRDITERKNVQAKIAAERQRLYLVLETLPAFVALIGQDHSIYYVNRKFRERFGDPTGRLWYEVVCGSQKPCAECKTMEVFKTGSPEFWEMTAPDGRVYQIHDYPYTDTDGSNLVLQLGLDITDQKEIESERIARQAAEAANQQKSLFLSNMSHEIRTPMNAILGFAQILERDPNLSSKQLEQIRSINRSGYHLLGLINDILDMSKIEAGMSVLKPKVFSLCDLLDDLAMMFQSRAEGKNIQFVVERDESVPDYVLADENKVRQVLINLLGNAIKFTEVGGVSMRVRATKPENPSADKPETLQLTVEIEDSGPGISDAELARIFTPFNQGEAGANAGGTGLGLAISRRLAEMMNGSITVTTQVGHGSCFRFDMLLERSEKEHKEERAEQRTVTGLAEGSDHYRILVVDDQPNNRELLCALLKPLGFEIREATNGKEALEIFEEWSPDAVLMDMRMPVMDGYEATRRIKASEKGHVTPVIAVTASAFKDSEDLVRATGVSAYLRKPFRPEELWDALGECLGLHYQYADAKPVISKKPARVNVHEIDAARIAALPADLLLSMRQSVDEGDMTQFLVLLERVEELDAESARALRFLADRYDYLRLATLLANGGNNDA